MCGWGFERQTIFSAWNVDTREWEQIAWSGTCDSQCDQIGIFLKFFATNFRSKSSHNILATIWATLKSISLSWQQFGQLWIKFGLLFIAPSGHTACEASFCARASEGVRENVRVKQADKSACEMSVAWKSVVCVNRWGRIQSFWIASFGAKFKFFFIKRTLEHFFHSFEPFLCKNFGN